MSLPLLRLSLVVLGVFAAGCSRSPEVRFGSLNGGTVQETTRIRHRVGDSYGYSILFPKARGIVRIREEFTLPAAAPWASTTPPDPAITVIAEQKTADGSKSTQEIEFDAVEGSFYTHNFAIIRGDPKGRHVIQLWLDGRPLQTIEFDVE